MFSSRKRSLLLGMGMILAAGAILVAGAIARAAQHGYYGYGAKATLDEIAGWDIDARGDDGAGLPPGKGTVQKGSEVFADQCAACHGTFGEGEGRFPKLAGGAGTLRSDRPEPTVGGYWPFAPPCVCFINPARPTPP